MYGYLLWTFAPAALLEDHAPRCVCGSKLTCTSVRDRVRSFVEEEGPELVNKVLSGPFLQNLPLQETPVPVTDSAPWPGFS